MHSSCIQRTDQSMQSYVWPAPSHMNPHCVSFCRESSEWHSTTVILNIIYSHTLFTYCFFSSLPGRHTEEKKKKKAQEQTEHSETCCALHRNWYCCYNLFCTQSTGVLSLSFHSTAHTWNRDAVQTLTCTHTQSRNSQQPACTVQQAKQHFIKLSRIFLPLYFASDWTNGINNV